MLIELKSAYFSTTALFEIMMKVVDIAVVVVVRWCARYCSDEFDDLDKLDDFDAKSNVDAL